MSDSERAALSLFDGAAEILDLLASAAIVVDDANVMLRSTSGAQVYGLVQNRFLDHDDLLNLVSRVRSSGESESFETSISIGPRASVNWVSARAARLGKKLVLLLIEDRTEAKRLEDTRRDFVANISHELKTPIGAIGLLAETLIEATDDAELVKKFAGNLQRESERLAHLVQDIIELSRLQSAIPLANFSVLDLAQVIFEAADRNTVLAESKGVRLVVRAESGSHCLGDGDQLTAAVKNLIENAILYSEKNSQVGIGLSVDDTWADIAVTDSGIGIPLDEQSRVFERFYRVDPSRSRQTGGTGLGLSIVKHIAMNHQGEVKVFSQPGLGSTFTLRVPLVKIHETENFELDSKKSNSQSSKGED